MLSQQWAAAVLMPNPWRKALKSSCLSAWCCFWRSFDPWTYWNPLEQAGYAYVSPDWAKMARWASDRCKILIIYHYYDLRLYFYWHVCHSDHPLHFWRQMGINRFVFRKLLHKLEKKVGLRPTWYVSTEEQLVIFLHIPQTGLSNAEMQERFQHSGDTISK